MADATSNCPHCGKRLTRPDASFCTNCGTPLKSQAVQTTATVHGGSLAKIIVHLPGQDTQEEFLSKTVATLGRRRSNTIQVLSAIVSGEHARIELTRKGHTITDLNSTNGTFVNGRRLKPGQAHLLVSSDIIRFTDRLGNSASLTYIAPSGFGEMAEVDVSQTFHLTANISYIGRNPEAGITLDHPAVSWNHARVIRRAEDRYTIQDLSSNNGTFLNGSQLRQERSLERGDVIQIGPFNLVYRSTGTFVPYSAERNFRLEAVNLEKTIYASSFFGVKRKNAAKTILRDLNLVINPREFIALVGSSGAGKSTLLKALSGVSPATAGTVLVNGDNLYQNFNLYRNLMGYVPQDDIIHQGIELRRALRYAARLRLPDAGRSEIETRIDEVLAKVGLRGQASSVIQNLSGGQRKRVSIAAELLAEPWIFFLDEPTSGLDPGLEKLMMDTLRQLADEGRTIVLVTHATRNIINNCDQVAFMTRGGELAYFGPPDQATAFFGVDNFPDIYTQLAQTFTFDDSQSVPEKIRPDYENFVQTRQPSPQNGDAPPMLAGSIWAAHYRQSPLYGAYIANRQSGELARPITATVGAATAGMMEQAKQFVVLAQRYLDLIRHDRLSLWVLLAAMPIIGVLLLLISDRAALVGNTSQEIAAILETQGVYSIADKAQTLLFMMALSANLLGIFAASFEIIKEEPIYRRERMINLGIPPYFASKFVVLGAFMVLQCLLFLIILSVKIDLPRRGAILWSPVEDYFSLVFTALASVALGLFISALASSRNVVIYLVLIALFVQIVFSGAIFELSPLTQPLSFLTISRWSLEALGASTDMETLNSLGQVRVEREVDFGRGLQKVVEDVPTSIRFYANFAHSGLALLSRWIFLFVHTLLWSGLAIWLIKRQDEI